ncbi:MAG: type II toxin-antitoxin system VapC family toxin [Steroidobacteraceae bacterium]
MRAIDTNVLVRLLVRDEPDQVGAAEEFTAPGAWVSHLVLAETVWVLDSVYERGPEQIATALEMILNHKSITLQDSETVLAALGEYRRQLAVGFTDLLILEVARKAGHLPLGTFDRALAELDDVVRLK